MGNSFGCSASGERLVSAARDGDFVEAKMLLDCNPCLAKYSTFGGLNSPLHFAAAKGHNEIVALLLENGADVNSRNYCGQTALMQACRYGHWEIVQTLLLFRCNVIRADYLSGRTALHFAAVNGHVRCIRLVVADFVPSTPFESINAQAVGGRGDGSNTRNKYDQSALSKFVNKAADGGITALHMAALNGYFDCVQLLLDLHANVSAVTFHYGTSMDLIGAGSTPLHYAACGGNLKCCQILLARGASRLTLNCNGWLPLDVARMWGRHWLEPLLAPNSDSTIPVFPPSNYLSLPLISVLNIARECGLQSTTCSDDTEICAVCLERACTVAAEESGKVGLSGFGRILGARNIHCVDGFQGCSGLLWIAMLWLPTAIALIAVGCFGMFGFGEPFRIGSWMMLLAYWTFCMDRRWMALGRTF
ncbi:E3 ubiquitin-protein ligase XBAT33-like isoform X2 [Cornus florida]|uniref:E3 ubiquitin-protein ligase XBAT33-like isoform X2 n=1 Tax=Cornus florida TaxID=4283 RepID=UPI0028A28AA0|nr:E3 ubiquitin-protein ligase XBAT33-like isoform X2 [Cornus florida]